MTNPKLREKIFSILTNPKNWCPSKAEQWKRMADQLEKIIEEEIQDDECVNYCQEIATYEKDYIPKSEVIRMLKKTFIIDNDYLSFIKAQYLIKELEKE